MDRRDEHSQHLFHRKKMNSGQKPQANPTAQTVVTTGNHRVRSARPKRVFTPEPVEPRHWAVKFASRVAMSISYRSRRAVSREFWASIKRDSLFFARNVLLLNRPLRIRAGGLDYSLAPKGAVALEMWTGQYFEKHELEFLLGVLKPGMTFIDVGANTGLFSIPAAMRVRSGRVYAFEPSLSTYKRLIKNIRLNNLSSVQAACAALGDYVGEAVLRVNVAGKDGLNTIGKPTHPLCEIAREEAVPITTLDTFLRENGISHVDAMKIDVEGAEPLVLRGAAELLAKPNAPLILFECSLLSSGLGYHPVESIWLLEEIGYSLFAIDPNDGAISIPFRKPAFDWTFVMAIAVKPTHPSYSELRGRAR